MNRLFGTPFHDELTGNRSVKDVKGYNDPDGLGRITVFDAREKRYLNEKPQPSGEQVKVRVYTKNKLQGNVYELDVGSYTNQMLRDFFLTNKENRNIFSLSLPPKTTVTLYSGNDFDLAGKGSISYTNITKDVMRINELPVPIGGNVNSIDVVYHTVDPEFLGVERTFLDDRTISNAITERGDLILSKKVLNDYRDDLDVLGLDNTENSNDNSDDNSDNNEKETFVVSVNNDTDYYLEIIVILIMLCVLLIIIY